MDDIAELSQDFAAVAGSLSALRNSAAAFLREHRDADQQLFRGVAVAVTEAGSNVVRHAYPPPSTGLIRLTIRLAGRRLTIEVSDSGVGLDSRSYGGLGLALIRDVAKLELLDSPEGGTLVRMTFTGSGSGTDGVRFLKARPLFGDGDLSISSNMTESTNLATKLGEMKSPSVQPSKAVQANAHRQSGLA